MYAALFAFHISLFFAWLITPRKYIRIWGVCVVDFDREVIILDYKGPYTLYYLYITRKCKYNDQILEIVSASCGA